MASSTEPPDAAVVVEGQLAGRRSGRGCGGRGRRSTGLGRERQNNPSATSMAGRSAGIASGHWLSASDAADGMRCRAAAAAPRRAAR